VATQFPDEQSSQGSSQIWTRARRLLLHPAQEWTAIERESISTTRIVLGWIIPFAAIGPVVHLLGRLLFGDNFLGFHYQPSLGMALSAAITSYLLGLVAIGLVVVAARALAPQFGGSATAAQALKLVAFAMTAHWLVGIFSFFPGTRLLAFAGLYSCYLLFLGVPKLVKVPEEKTLAYTVAIILVAMAMQASVGAIAQSVSSRFASPTGVVSTTETTRFGVLNR
jgi:hypothetical protein